MLTREQLLEMIQTEYRELKGGQRTLRESDSVVDRLEIDSLQAMELLHALEDEIGGSLIGDSRIQKVSTVGDIIDLAVAVQAGG